MMRRPVTCEDVRRANLPNRLAKDASGIKT